MTKYEDYAATYKKNAERMLVLKALIDTAKKREDIETARKLRREYTDLKAEIDAAAFGVIFEK